MCKGSVRDVVNNMRGDPANDMERGVMRDIVRDLIRDGVNDVEEGCD